MTDFNTARREAVAAAIEEGRATYLPAGARDNATARILIDGIEVAQASLMQVYTDPRASTTFREVPLITRHEWARLIEEIL